MEKNINEILFGEMTPTEKLSAIQSLDDDAVRRTPASAILRMYNERHGDRDRFYISPDRRKGNNWNSTIEFVFEHKGQPCLCLYVQSDSTDSSTCVSYDNFNSGNRYGGYCDNLHKSFSYDSSDIARTIRCILEDYIYWKYIEKDERERSENIRKVLYEIGGFNEVCNYFYDEWRCKYEGFGPWKTPRTDRYHRAEKAVKAYVEEHIDELMGKTRGELQTIYKRIFRETD